jgi:hypothetical protein
MKKKKLGKKMKILLIVIAVMLILAKLQYLISPFSFPENVDDNMVHYEQNNETLSLLEKYKPEVFIANGSYYPLDFYQDILPNTTLYKDDVIPKKITSDVTKEILEEYHLNSDYFIDLEIDHDDYLGMESLDQKTVSYGRIYESSIASEAGEIELLFLKYSFVFPYSGLPEGSSPVTKFFAGFITNPNRWHELDIHGSVYIILDKETETFLGVMLAQHNHFMTFLNGRELDSNGVGIQIGYSKYSNEPYLMEEESRFENVTGLPSNPEFRYGIGDKTPMFSGQDYIASIEDSFIINYDIKLLELDDPLYKSNLLLGDKTKLLGLYNTFMNSGPPGIDFYNAPQFLDLAKTMAIFYGDKEDPKYFELFNEDMDNFFTADGDLLIAYQNEKIVDIMLETLNEK